MRTRARVPGSSPEPGWTMAQHEAAAAAYWAAVHRRTGYSASSRPGLTTSQHILHLLLTVFTGGPFVDFAPEIVHQLRQADENEARFTAASRRFADCCTIGLVSRAVRCVEACGVATGSVPIAGA